MSQTACNCNAGGEICFFGGGDGATPHKLKLHHRNEVVTFTSSMEIDDHVLGFALRTERL